MTESTVSPRGIFKRNTIGMKTDPVTSEVEAGRLSFFCETLGETNPIHHDAEAARAAGFPGVVAALTVPMLVDTEVARTTDRAGIDRVFSLSARFLAITPVNAKLECSGEGVERFEQDGVPHLRIALHAQITNAEGQSVKSLAGEAIIKVEQYA